MKQTVAITLKQPIYLQKMIHLETDLKSNVTITNPSEKKRASIATIYRMKQKNQKRWREGAKMYSMALSER